MLPPESVPARVATLGVRTSNCAHELAGVAIDLGALDAPAAPERPLADALEDEVQADAERADDALAEPVVGDVAQAELLPRAHVELADRRAEEPHLARRGAPLPGDDLGELALAVAVHAGHAQDLARVQDERDALDARGHPLALSADALELEQDLAADLRRLPPLGEGALELGDRRFAAGLLAEHDAHDLGLQLLGRARAQLALGQRCRRRAPA